MGGAFTGIIAMWARWCQISDVAANVDLDC